MLILKEMFGEQGCSAKQETMRQIYNTKMAEESFKEFRLNYNMNKKIYALSELMNELVAAEGILGTSSVDANMAEVSTSQPKSKGKGKKKKKKKKKKDFTKIQRLIKDGRLEPLDFEGFPVCESCLEGKMTKRPFDAKGRRAQELLELVHTDVCGPMSTQEKGGYEYFITFTDDYSRYGYVNLSKQKSEALEKFKEFRAEI
ncbi:uncharacterized protein LOC115966264 [Quercus lobata]|uniref:uncharacterized protein LOC115966264 n=1 Tax=Quercus lobata TaxID=97700 RepID=UPI001246E9C6|nr:uncharacterized protein LOC115966264 [Quercus lobata]